MIQIDRTEIETWGRKTHESHANFPKLIGKLILETTPPSTKLSVPAGSAVYFKGWDGIVTCSEKINFVPEGISLWEIGANGDLDKAQRDFKKRTSDSKGYDLTQSTFVFVTTLSFDDEVKEKWIEKRMKSSEWKNIVIIDGNDICLWLENAQVSLRWFKILKRDVPYDKIYPNEESWQMLSIGQYGEISPIVITSGRESQVDDVLAFLNGEPELKAVKASTRKEALTFILAAIQQFKPEFRELFNAKGLVIKDIDDFHHIRINKNALVITANISYDGSLHLAKKNGHHVLLPLGADDSFREEKIIDLPGIKRSGQVQGLIEMGIPKDKAERLSREAGRDFTILFHLMNDSVSLEKASKSDFESLIPFIFLGKWNDENIGDQKLVQSLSGIEYTQYTETLPDWMNRDFSPIKKIGEQWRLISPLDTWTIFSKFIGDKRLSDFRGLALDVLTEIHPKFKFSKDDRHKYNLMIDREPVKYSDWCKEGIVQTLILIAVYGDRLQLSHSSSQLWVDDFIKSLLKGASTELWSSLTGLLPLLAEASPESFMESVEESIKLDDGRIMGMFIEEKGFLSENSYQHGLLWALESLAWDPDYFHRSCLILAKLATLDPGGRMSNRPINSLIEIFKPWHFQTFASLEARQNTLEAIIKEDNNVGWKLLLSCFPEWRGIAQPTHKYRWRLFDQSYDIKYGKKQDEINDMHRTVVDIALEYCDYSEEKVASLIDCIDTTVLDFNQRKRILDNIIKNVDHIEQKEYLPYHNLRKILSSSRSHPETDWAIPEKELQHYQSLFEKLRPNNLLDNVKWLFNEHWIELPEKMDDTKDYEDSLKRQREIRVEALQKLYDEFGLSELKSLVGSVKENGSLGQTFAYVVKDLNEIIGLCNFLKGNKGELLFIQSFLYTLEFVNDKENFVFDLFDKLNKEQSWSDRELAKFFLAFRSTINLWRYLDQLSQS
ncbi:MAG: hypothetical protein JJU02_02410, partial [Cryomorphaceae bacterium]|nr:hypothetical protein [Cryomorphaceae bacterium]